MPEKWTGDVVGQMHVYRITRDQLAMKLGQHPKYVIAVLNGKRKPEGAEAAYKAALNELIAEREAQMLEAGA